jgi:hypothetical protein
LSPRRVFTFVDSFLEMKYCGPFQSFKERLTPIMFPGAKLHRFTK